MALNQSFRIAKRENIISVNPCNNLTLPLSPTKKIMPLTEDEEALVENACEKTILGFLFVFLLKTGLRRSELINLKWTDYNTRTRELSITKSKTPSGIRTIYLLPEAIAIIESQPQINEYIFNNTKKRPVQSISLRRLYERLREITGINHITNHVCRHTFVTRCCEQEISPKAIAQIIGHAKVDYVMDIYAMIEKKKLQKSIYKLVNGVSDKQTTCSLVTLPNIIYQQYEAAAHLYGQDINKYLSAL